MLMKKSIILGLLIAGTLVLGACSKGNTTSGTGGAGQQTSNSVGDGGTGSGAGISGGAGISTLPSDGNLLPIHCAKLGYTYVPRKIGNSYQSYLDCDAWDPRNPAQNSDLVNI